MAPSMPIDRPGARAAGPELLLLAQWEEFVAWLLAHTGRWPKSARFSLSQRVENHALDITEMLVTARYEPRHRAGLLYDVNLRLERMRHLFRLAHGAQVMPARGFESAMRGVDECGRMLHGWRSTLAERAKGGAPAEEAVVHR